MTRLDRTLVVRDRFLELLRHQGLVCRDNDRAWMEWKQGEWPVVHRAPFCDVPGARQSQRAWLMREAFGQGKPVLSYRMDVWRGAKVMNLQWSGKGRLDLISFGSGSWEQ